MTFEPPLATVKLTGPAGAWSLDTVHEESVEVTEIGPLPPPAVWLLVVAFCVQAASTGTATRSAAGRTKRMAGGSFFGRLGPQTDCLSGDGAGVAATTGRLRRRTPSTNTVIVIER